MSLFKSVYPKFDLEMRAKRYTVSSLCQAAGLKYMTIYKKVKTGKNLGLDEAILLKDTLESELDVEELFEKVVEDDKAYFKGRNAS